MSKEIYTQINVTVQALVMNSTTITRTTFEHTPSFDKIIMSVSNGSDILTLKVDTSEEEVSVSTVTKGTSMRSNPVKIGISDTIPLILLERYLDRLLKHVPDLLDISTRMDHDMRCQLGFSYPDITLGILTAYAENTHIGVDTLSAWLLRASVTFTDMKSNSSFSIKHYDQYGYYRIGYRGQMQYHIANDVPEVIQSIWDDFGDSFTLHAASSYSTETALSDTVDPTPTESRGLYWIRRFFAMKKGSGLDSARKYIGTALYYNPSGKFTIDGIAIHVMRDGRKIRMIIQKDNNTARDVQAKNFAEFYGKLRSHLPTIHDWLNPNK